jgi:hypothetical protein
MVRACLAGDGRDVITLAEDACKVRPGAAPGAVAGPRGLAVGHGDRHGWQDGIDDFNTTTRTRPRSLPVVGYDADRSSRGSARQSRCYAMSAECVTPHQ